MPWMDGYASVPHHGDRSFKLQALPAYAGSSCRPHHQARQHLHQGPSGFARPSSMPCCRLRGSPSTVSNSPPMWVLKASRWTPWPRTVRSEAIRSAAEQTGLRIHSVMNKAGNWAFPLSSEQPGRGRQGPGTAPARVESSGRLEGRLRAAGAGRGHPARSAIVRPGSGRNA